jgi:ketosteroid isomerase-like protein
MNIFLRRYLTWDDLRQGGAPRVWQQMFCKPDYAAHGTAVRVGAWEEIGEEKSKEDIVSNVDTVKQIYEAFGRGDIPAIMGKLDPNVEWDVEIAAAGVPWLQPRRGAANVPAFFESLAPLSFQRFEPHTFFADGNKVFALVALDVRHTPSGKHYKFPHEGHLWHFNDADKVVKYQHVTDTAQHQRMAKGE